MKDWIANLVNVTPAKGDRGRETEVRKREQELGRLKIKDSQ